MIFDLRQTQPVSYSSGHMLVLCRNAVARSHESPPEAQVAIILAAIAIEGFLNETAHSALLDQWPENVRAVGRLMELAEHERMQPRLKYELLHYGLAGLLPNRGDRVMQDFDALFGIRNGIAHLKPLDTVWLDDAHQLRSRKNYPKAIRHLISSGVARVPTGPGHHWRQFLYSAQVARWAHNTAVRSLHGLVQGIQQGDFREYMSWRVEALNELQETQGASSTS